MTELPIVVIDPEEARRAALEQAFRAQGISVHFLASTAEARELVRHTLPAALVLDADDPHVEELVAHLRGRGAFDAIAVVARARSTGAARGAVARLGAREGLEKAAHPLSVVDAVRRALRRSTEESPLRNEVRRRILEVLRDGERTAGDIAKLLDRRRPSLSHHFSELARHGIVRCRQDGPFRYYSIDPQGARDAWNDWLAGG